MNTTLLDSAVAQTREVAAWVEGAVHRIDAAFALDRGWAANVPGFTEAMRGDGQTIAWVADDADRAWLLRRTDAPLVLTHDRGEADVAIHGPARELLQIVSRRRPLDAAESCVVTGDRNELAHLIDHMNWVGGA